MAVIREIDTQDKRVWSKFQFWLFRCWSEIEKSYIEHIKENPLFNYLSTIFFSVIVGIVVGLVTIAFYWLIKSLSHFCFGYLLPRIPLSKYGIAIFPIIGGIICGIMIYLAPHLARQKGVVEIIKANFITSGIIKFKSVLYHFVAPIFFLGMGGTLGPEAPAAQLGGGVSSLIGQLFKLPERKLRMFLAAGTAAAISAIFNSPIGGVFFSIEIVLFNNFQALSFSSLIVAAVTGNYISRIILSDTPILILPVSNIAISPQILLYSLLGLLSGVLALGFIKFSIYLNKAKDKVFSKIPQYFIIVILMGILGVVGVFYPQLLGIGYDAIREFALTEGLWSDILILLVFKFLLVLLFHVAGGFGGLFAPSLFIGAALGSLFTIAMKSIFGIELDPGVSIICGMGGVLAGINSIPVTALLVLMELTGNYRVVLPLMLSIVFSYIIVHYFLRESVYSIELKRQGINIYDGQDFNILRNIKIRKVMSPEFHKVYVDMPLRTIIKIIGASSANTHWVEDKNGHLIGYISWNDLKPLMTDFENLEPLITISDIMNPNLITVTPDDDLDYVMKLFGNTNLEELPVIDPSTHRLIGTVYRNKVIQLYNQEVFKRETASDLAVNIRFADQARLVEIDNDLSILEINSPKEFYGKDIQSINLRKRYNVQVVLIKRLGESGDKVFIAPSAETFILPNDVLILVGPTRKLQSFRERYLQ